MSNSTDDDPNGVEMMDIDYLDPASSVPSPDPARTNVSNFVNHIHYACLHAYIPEKADSKDELHISEYMIAPPSADNSVAPILQVLHPRWCPECVAARTAALEASFQIRFAKLGATIHCATYHTHVLLRREVAYLKGVFRGRVHALSAPLEFDARLVFLDEGGNESGLDEVMSKLSVKMVGTCSAGNEVYDEMVQMLGEVVVKYDELEWDLETAFMEMREEEMGFVDGMEIQATLERIATDEERLEKRNELLRAALL
jgi:hypothetical protein